MPIAVQPIPKKDWITLFKIVDRFASEPAFDEPVLFQTFASLTDTAHVLQKRRLGRTNRYVTTLGLGGAWLGQTTKDVYNEEVAIHTVLTALEAGINLIDTSPIYSGGRSEEFIGRALKEWYRRDGRREDLFLSSKTGTRTIPKDYSADATYRSVELSLKALQTDYLDAVHIHDPEDLTPVFAKGGALEALMKWKSQGIVRAIGIGGRTHEDHRQCIETGEFDVCLTYRDYNLVRQSVLSGVVELAERYDVGILNGMAVLKGLLGGRNPKDVEHEFAFPSGNPLPKPYFFQEGEVAKSHELWKWAQVHNLDLLALNLQFCLRQPRITSTLVGASNPMELENDLAAISSEVAAQVWTELYSTFKMS